MPSGKRERSGLVVPRQSEAVNCGMEGNSHGGCSWDRKLKLERADSRYLAGRDQSQCRQPRSLARILVPSGLFPHDIVRNQFRFDAWLGSGFARHADEVCGRSSAFHCLQSRAPGTFADNRKWKGLVFTAVRAVVLLIGDFGTD